MQIPDTLKPGQHYYAVTPNGRDPKRKYLYEITRPTTPEGDNIIRTAPVRSMGKKFKDVQLARSFVDFLNRRHDGDEYCLVIE